MGRYFGVIGYAETKQTEPGVFEEVITERIYFSDVNRSSRRLESSGGINDNITINNEFSILADPYAIQNIYAMRYIEFQGAKWKITNAEVQYPRLKLTVGGLWNE